MGIGIDKGFSHCLDCQAGVFTKRADRPDYLGTVRPGCVPQLLHVGRKRTAPEQNAAGLERARGRRLRSCRNGAVNPFQYNVVDPEVVAGRTAVPSHTDETERVPSLFQVQPAKRAVHRNVDFGQIVVEHFRAGRRYL